MLIDGAGQHKEAEEMQRATMEMMKRVLGDDDDFTMNATHGLANALFNQEKYIESLVFREEVLKQRRRVFGPENPSTLDATESVILTLVPIVNDDTLIRAEKMAGENPLP